MTAQIPLTPPENNTPAQLGEARAIQEAAEEMASRKIQGTTEATRNEITKLFRNDTRFEI